jgi:hypothetical protein
MLTNAELIKELRKPGKVYVPVLISGGVEYLAAEKSDMISLLLDLEPKEAAYWCFYGEYNGHRKLDVQGE